MPRRGKHYSARILCYVPVGSLQKLMLREQFGSGDGHFVAAFVFRMARMAADDREADAMFRQQFVEFAPVLFILEGLELPPLTPAPTISLPARKPFLTTPCDVF